MILGARGLRGRRPGGGAARLVGVDLGHPFLWPWRAQRWCAGSCAAVVCTEQFLQPRAAFLIYVRARRRPKACRSAKVRVRISAPARAAVIFVPSLNTLIRIPGGSEKEMGRRHGTWVCGPRRRQPKQPRSVRLVLVAVAAVSDGIHDQLTALGSYQIFLRNQDRERGGVWGVGFCVVAAQDFCDAARRLEGCFSASESAA